MKKILLLLVFTIISLPTFAGPKEILSCTSVFGGEITLSQKAKKYIVSVREADGSKAVYKNLRELSADEVASEYEGIERVFASGSKNVVFGVILESPEDNAFDSVLVVDGLMIAAKCLK